MPRAVLVGLKKYPVKISVICAMLDSGGSAGRLRKDYKIASPGDIRRAFLALANTSPIIEDLFNFRFQAGDLKDHNFANLFITALELTTNDYEKTIKEVSRILNVKHEVLPSTLDKANLCAVLENGKIISGETNIDIPKHNGNLRIKRVFLKPRAKAYPKAIEAIKKADLIIIGPGDLYSSLAQILLTYGIPQAIRKSKAKKVYICNLMTKYGETNNFTASDFTREIEKFLGQKGDEDKSSSSPFAKARVLDYVIYNTETPSPKRLKAFKKKHPELLDLVRFDKKPAPYRNAVSGAGFIGTDLLIKSDDIIHDPQKLVKIVLSLL